METTLETPGANARAQAVPPLQSGDHLTRAEFERRREAMPPTVKAERIEGVVYMLTSVRLQSHGQPHFLVVTWLGLYAAATSGVEGGDNATVRLDPDNDAQPDALLLIDPVCGGQAHISSDDYLEGAPELVVEVAASSASYDLHEKKRVYRRNGVQEYLVWQVHDERLDWFVLENERYVPLEPDEEGFLKSRTLPGLHLNVEALLKGNGAAVLEAGRAGMQTEAHTAFVEQLKRRRTEESGG